MEDVEGSTYNSSPELSKNTVLNGSGGQVYITLLILIVGGAAWFLLLHWIQAKRLQGRLPPGPPPWPIVGSLFHVLASKQPIHEVLAKLARSYGPVMFLRLGSLPCIVITSANVAEVVLNDSRFAHRATETLLYTLRNLEFDNQGFMSHYHAQLKLLRKLCSTELLTTSRVASFAKVRKDEVLSTLKDLASTINAKQPVSVREALGPQGMNVMTGIIFRERFFGSNVQVANDFRQFKEVLPEILQLAGTISWPDLFPAIRWLDLQGRARQYKKLRLQMEQAYRIIIEDYKIKAVNVDDDNSANFIEVLLSQQSKNQLSDKTIMATIQELFIGGSESFASTVEWILAELVRNYPDKLRRLQKEIDDVTGCVRQVEESDFPNLPYLRACVREALRLYPALPLLIPRETEEATTLNGYYIPPKTVVLVNAWQIGRDPTFYQNPHKFEPERFLSAIQREVSDYHYLPFGAGRRVCVGMKLGIAMIQITLASLVHAFDWAPPHGMEPKDINLTPTDGMVLVPKFHIQYQAVSRLEPSVYNLPS